MSVTKTAQTESAIGRGLILVFLLKAWVINQEARSRQESISVATGQFVDVLINIVENDI